MIEIDFQESLLQSYPELSSLYIRSNYATPHSICGVVYSFITFAATPTRLFHFGDNSHNLMRLSAEPALFYGLIADPRVHMNGAHVHINGAHVHMNGAHVHMNRVEGFTPTRQNLLFLKLRGVDFRYTTLTS